MKCMRCQNLTVTETFVDYGMSVGAMSFVGYRCIACGDISDATIQRHRTSQAAPRWETRRRRFFSISAGQRRSEG